MSASKHREELLYRGVAEGHLEIDGQGRIWRIAVRKGRKGGKSTLVVPCKRRRAEHATPQGYLQISARYDGHLYAAYAHRVVWYHFHGHIPGNLTINHKDGIKDYNHPGNLELATHSENSLHGYRVLGRVAPVPEGERHPAAKLSTTQVMEIRRRREAGETCVAISLDFDIHQSTVSRIARKVRRPDG